METFDFGSIKPAPAWNEEVTRSHAGEDGPCWKIVEHRQMFLEDQEWTALIYGGQSWAVWERVNVDESTESE